jgi:hypothetical protein
MAKQLGWSKALKMSDMVRKARIRRKLRRGKKQAQGAGERERGGMHWLLACLLRTEEESIHVGELHSVIIVEQ